MSSLLNQAYDRSDVVGCLVDWRVLKLMHRRAYPIILSVLFSNFTRVDCEGPRDDGNYWTFHLCTENLTFM